MRNDFDPTAIIDDLRRKQQLRRRNIYRRSRLDRYRAELVALRLAGASFAHLQMWLKERRVDAARSTIKRYFDHLPEVSNGTVR